MTGAAPDSGGVRLREFWLLAATFLVAVSGLIYELIAATLSSYLLGDSVRQFSLVIGVFLSAMGLGAWLSRFVGQAMSGFIWAQIGLGVAGGFMAPAIFFSYAWMESVSVPLYGLLVLVGVLSGMEIPLIARVLKQIGAPEFRFENVLSVDYAGALAASVAFPLLIIPQLGLMSASLSFGALNLGVAGLSLWVFRADASRAQAAVWTVVFTATLAGLWQSERLVSVAEADLFEDDIILSEATLYQQITVTRYKDRVRLFLDYSIQFDTLDEHRYHESLVHPAMGLAPRRKDVLILGGGDGMAVREVLRWAEVESVTLVDLDPRVTELFRGHPQLSALNGGALKDSRVTIRNMDAWKFVEGTDRVFDVIIADLPDPKNLALSKLYTRQFYGALMERLSAQGVVVTQAGSPLFARSAFWSVAGTLKAARNPYRPGEGLQVLPYHAYVPSFGDWGFVLATPQALRPRELTLPAGLKFLNAAVWQAAQVFGDDTGPVDVAINSLQSHALAGYYQDGWDQWFE
ncbi:polyamine aminopropyltransferase [Leisingera sp. HS039]|uniref:polyamine aminopropyltransferase n=1 Tax=unclassified Leisingera TaxID=2614906 RepID=UPI001070B913|nr:MULTISPECIES: polyamine aminopropyltransferase [unclassified Leisingera]MBQ4824045.1 polyamine aminopropyltransferase [Leisingera sp. HS039]QBR35201.1 polyamine aminopropyltransferase [Leisingera sp. NJS201]